MLLLYSQALGKVQSYMALLKESFTRTRIEEEAPQRSTKGTKISGKLCAFVLLCGFHSF
jgi:hypothetical protein